MTLFGYKISFSLETVTRSYQDKPYIWGLILRVERVDKQGEGGDS